MVLCMKQQLMIFFNKIYNPNHTFQLRCIKIKINLMHLMLMSYSAFMLVFNAFKVQDRSFNVIDSHFFILIMEL